MHNDFIETRGLIYENIRCRKQFQGNMANILRLVSRRNVFNLNNISCRELYSYQAICQKSSVGVEFKDAETISELKSDKKHGLDLTFSSAEEAFRSKKTSELIRALLVFNLCSVDFLVNNHRQVSTNNCCNTCFG